MSSEMDEQVDNLHEEVAELKQQIAQLTKEVDMLRKCNEQLVASEQMIRVEANSLRSKVDPMWRELIAHRDKAHGDYWAWDKDEAENHIESTSCAVLIHPTDLRAILNERDDALALRDDALALLGARKMTIDELKTRAETAESALKRVRCIYCNSEYTADQKDELADHICTCEKSPLVKHLKELDSRIIDRMDMVTDEFLRILAITDNKEIVGICERAQQVIEQKEPVIKQRNDAVKRADAAEAKCAEMRNAILKHKQFVDSVNPSPCKGDVELHAVLKDLAFKE